MWKLLLALCAIACINFNLCIAQGTRTIYIDEAYNGQKLTSLLRSISAQYDVEIIYDQNDLDGFTVFGIGKPYKLEDFLNVFLPSRKTVKVSKNEYIIIPTAVWDVYGSGSNSYVSSYKSSSGKNVVKGQILDQSTLEPVIGAEIYFPKLKTGTLTDVNGNFELSVPQGYHELEIRYLGYDSETRILFFSKYGLQNLELYLNQSSTQLANVTITAEAHDKNVTSNITGVEKLDIEELKTLPTFMGEIDPIKGLTTLPGVSTVGELAAGFNVRGGDAGQNLVLQDEGVIYNPTHLFGFFSAFNPDMVQDVELLKGGGPSMYGGRVASVLDIGLKNGQMSKHQLSGGVGLISSRLALEGPIKFNKTSYMVGARAAYPNWLIHSVNNLQLSQSKANFYDVTAKLFHIANEDNILTGTFYYSYDDFNFGSDSTYSWGTVNGSLLWDHSFNSSTTARVVIASSNYHSQLNNAFEYGGFKYRNGIQNQKLKVEIINNRETLNIHYGVEGNRYFMMPGELKPTKNDGITQAKKVNGQTGVEAAAFANVELASSLNWGVTFGLRASAFARMGKDDIYTFDFENLNGRYPSIVDTTHYGGGEIVKTFGALEPRVSVRYLINKNNSLKASYYRSAQYIHLISYTTSPTPQDYWIASGPHIKPEIANQFSMGYFRNSDNGAFEYSLEGYYKQIENTIDYIEGADIVLNESLEGGLAQGDGLAYGVELQIKKLQGRLYGWMSYTWSRSLRKFESMEGNLQMINNGEYYPSLHDQPHNLSLVVNYKTGNRSVLSANFSYSTGRPITIPVSKFGYGPYLSALNFSDRNEYRIPDYHRLDVSWSIKDKKYKNKRFYGEWILSIYNLYGRKNAYSIFFTPYGNARKLSVMGSVFPSLSYNFTF